MFSIVGKASDEDVFRSCFGFARKELGIKQFLPISCPYFVKVIVILKEMIDFTLSMRKNFSEKTKKLLRWLLCATVTDCAKIAGPSFVEMRDQQVKSVSLESEKQCSAVTFQDLPAECKLHVFSYLTTVEKGRAERVCSQWRDLIRMPFLWKCIDLTEFSLHCQCPGRSCSNARCYDSYKERMEQFLNYLASIGPNLKEFRFAFDIIDSQDDWLRLLRNFIHSVHVQKLELAQLNWKETPVKPYPSEGATWSSNNYNDLMYRHRRRQRHFISFFDYFTAFATNLSTLILPFDWSAPTIKNLSRLQRLESLVLQSYFVPQPFQQETLDELLSAVPNVKHLNMTVCIGSGLGMLAYKFASKKLQSLDLSHCQGFSLEEVCLPSLTKFRTSYKSYICPFLDAGSTAPSTPCIYEVLRSGAPALLHLNDHKLRSGWRDNTYEELESVLRSVCACPVHQPV